MRAIDVRVSSCGYFGVHAANCCCLSHCLSHRPGLVKPWVTQDAAAARACVQFLEDHRVLVEPACGAGLAAVYEKSQALDGCNSVVVEVCGGALVDRETLQEWLA